MSYTKRYPGGFVDKPSLTTAADSQFFNAVEAALLKLLTADGSADGQVLQWINASSRFGPALLLNKNVDPAAGIVKSKLDLSGANGIVDADVAGAAAIAQSKISGLSASLTALALPVGAMIPWPIRLAPANYLLVDGSAVSRSTYSTLFNAIVPSLSAFTVTIASPGVFTRVAHQLVIGDRVYLTTTGALPTGLSANTIYYVVSTPSADTFTLSTTEGGAAINTTGSQSGVHTLMFCPWGLGNGSTTFNLPDTPGRTLVAAAGASGHADVRAMGQSDPNTIGNRRQRHQHTVVNPTVNSHTHTLANGHAFGGYFNAGSSTASASIDGGNDVHLSSTSLNAASPGTSGGTVGPQTNSPVDTPSNLVINVIIKYQ